MSDEEEYIRFWLRGLYAIVWSGDHYRYVSNKHNTVRLPASQCKYSRGCPSNPAIDHVPSVGGARFTWTSVIHLDNLPVTLPEWLNCPPTRVPSLGSPAEDWELLKHSTTLTPFFLCSYRSYCFLIIIGYIPLTVSLILWNIAAVKPIAYIIILFLYWIYNITTEHIIQEKNEFALPNE